MAEVAFAAETSYYVPPAPPTPVYVDQWFVEIRSFTERRRI